MNRENADFQCDSEMPGKLVRADPVTSSPNPFLFVPTRNNNQNGTARIVTGKKII